MRLMATIRADLEAFAELKGMRIQSPLQLIDVLAYPGVIAVIMFRCASFFHRRRLRPLSRILYFLNIVLFGCEIMPGAVIGPGLTIPHPVGIGIGSESRLGRKVRIMGLVRIGGGASGDRSSDGMPTIGDECWLLDGAKVFGPVTIGDRTVIGADTLVLSDLPGDVIAAGRPARVIRQRDAASGNPA